MTEVSALLIPLSTARLVADIRAADYAGGMAKPAHTRNVTDADREAAVRLRALWDAAPNRPTQQEMAHLLGGTSQSLTSQYLSGSIALNFKALMAFSKALGVDPSAIRIDLPEQQLTQSQHMRDWGRRINSRRLQLKRTVEAVHTALLSHDRLKGLPAPDLESTRRWFSGEEVPRDMRYWQAVFEVLEMDFEAAKRELPVAPRTALTQTLLGEIESWPVERQEAFLALIRAERGG